MLPTLLHAAAFATVATQRGHACCPCACCLRTQLSCDVVPSAVDVATLLLSVCLGQTTAIPMFSHSCCIGYFADIVAADVAVDVDTPLIRVLRLALKLGRAFRSPHHVEDCGLGCSRRINSGSGFRVYTRADNSCAPAVPFEIVCAAS